METMTGFPLGMYLKRCSGAAREEEPDPFPGRWELVLGRATWGNSVKRNPVLLLCSKTITGHRPSNVCSDPAPAGPDSV